MVLVVNSVEGLILATPMISSSNILEKSWLLSNPNRLVGPSLLVLCVLLVFSEFLLHSIFWIHCLSDESSLKSKIKFTNKKNKIRNSLFRLKCGLYQLFSNIGPHYYTLLIPLVGTND